MNLSKIILLFVSLSVAVYLTLVIDSTQARETLKVTVTPEREYVIAQPDSEIIFKIDLQGANLKSKRRLPINLALVLDHSGSMRGKKLEQAKQAACTVIDQLSSKDVLSVVIYDSTVETLIPPQHVTNPSALKRQIRQIQSRGSTALYGGVQKGAEELAEFFSAQRVNRIILLSDGIANVGPKSPSDLARLGSKLRRKGMTVSTVGLGDDYNEDLMVSLAESSAANYYYVQDVETLPKIFSEELGNIQNILARNIKIIIELPENIRPLEIMGHPEIKFNGQKAEISLNEFYGAQKRHYLVRAQTKSIKEKLLPTTVMVHYQDETSGQKAEVQRNASFKFAKTPEASLKSQNKDVAIEYELARNLQVREEALALADEGRAKDAEALLGRRAQYNSSLDRAFQQDTRFRSQNDSILNSAQKLKEEKKFDKVSRKSFQYENYKQKYQK